MKILKLIILIVFLSACNFKNENSSQKLLTEPISVIDSVNDVSQNNKEGVQKVDFVKCEPYFPEIMYVKRWDKWILKFPDSYLKHFTTFSDYHKNLDEPQQVNINADSTIVNIYYGMSGGDIYPAEQNWYRTNLNNHETDLIIITETHRSPEVTDSEIHIGKIENDSFEDLTDQYFPEIRASLFFPGVDSVTWMKKMIDWEFAYDHNGKKVIVTPVERYYMSCHNKLMPDVAKDNGTTPEQICETWKAYHDTPIDFIWNGATFSPEQQR